MLAWSRPKVDDAVGFPDRLFVVFDDDDRIAHIAQVLQGIDQLFIVARMQADRGFIQNIGDADQAAANLRSKATRCASPPESVGAVRSRVK